MLEVEVIGSALDAGEVRRACEVAAGAAGVRDGHVAVEFVDASRIAELNSEYRAKDGPTDVLSFPLDADDDPLPGVPVLLGDVVVCPAVASRQAAERSAPTEDELALLVVHGVLHLLDYDHAEPNEGVVMRRREQELLTRFREIEGRA